ncbi:MAG TPA: glutamyl-tRNA reductase [Dermatophilaceae bacterium]|nr:glutamyl-tRNA reductase [Dermatophilaceae bacterium]
MSVLVMGLSHRSAPIEILESASMSSGGVADLAAAVHAGENITEALVLATCNRVEVYAEVCTFHGAVSEIAAALAAATGMPKERLSDHLYVHYEDRAIAHAFSVACGLDSMAVGEGQILGQIRDALRRAQRDRQAGIVLNALFQHALRLGKQAHAETDLDRVGSGLVQAGLDGAGEALGDLRGARVLLVGAGSMSSLAASTVARLGVSELTIVNRTLERAQRLAWATAGRVGDLARLDLELRRADLLISCTGAMGHVVTVEVVRAALAGRAPGRPLVCVDLALPRDVEPEVAALEGVTLLGLTELSERLAADRTVATELDRVRDLVTAAVAEFLMERRAQQVGSTVAALRSRAASVVSAELDRLDGRLPDLTEAHRAEVRRAVHRVVEKLLHTPTVRVKQLVGTGEGGNYADALRELFDLDPHHAAAVFAPPDQGMP